MPVIIKLVSTRYVNENILIIPEEQQNEYYKFIKIHLNVN